MRWRAVFSLQASNLQSALTNRQWGESSSPLMQLAIQKEPPYPAGRPGREMRGGLTGTQVERDEENQKETPRTVAPSPAPSVALLFLHEQTCLMRAKGWGLVFFFPQVFNEVFCTADSFLFSFTLTLTLIHI